MRQSLATVCLLLLCYCLIEASYPTLCLVTCNLYFPNSAPYLCVYPGETFCRVVALKRASLKKKERKIVCKQMRLGQTEVEWKHQMSILSAGPHLSTVSATTDSYGAGETVASKVGAGEREGTGDGAEQK